MSITPLPLTVRDPIRASVAAHRLNAQQQLRRMTAQDVADVTALRAKHRLHKIRALVRFLNRTDPETADGIPERAERDRLLAPVLADLEKLARRAPRRRERKPSIPTKETLPMPTNRCLLADHPNHASGCIVDGPREAPAAPASNGVVLPDFPLALRPEIMAFEGAFSVPNSELVLKQRALDLAGRFLDCPERERRSLIAAFIYRQQKRRATANGRIV